MKTNKGTTEELKKDLSSLRIDDLESLTVQKVKTAYHKVALEVHPDKADYIPTGRNATWHGRIYLERLYRSRTGEIHHNRDKYTLSGIISPDRE